MINEEQGATTKAIIDKNDEFIFSNLLADLSAPTAADVTKSNDNFKIIFPVEVVPGTILYDIWEVERDGPDPYGLKM